MVRNVNRNWVCDSEIQLLIFLDILKNASTLKSMAGKNPGSGAG